MKYQVIGLAVAFVIGTAATKMVNATITDLIMPVIIAVLILGGDWWNVTLDIGPIDFMVGDFVGTLIDFVIIALGLLHSLSFC